MIMWPALQSNSFAKNTFHAVKSLRKKEEWKRRLSVWCKHEGDTKVFPGGKIRNLMSGGRKCYTSSFAVF